MIVLDTQGLKMGIPVVNNVFFVQDTNCFRESFPVMEATDLLAIEKVVLVSGEKP